VKSLTMPTVGVSRTSVLLIAAVIAIICGFGGALLQLVQTWNQHEEYSHGFLIPVVTAWLLWTRRDALRNSVGRPSWIGAILISLALAMHAIGGLSAISVFSQIGFVIALLGMVLAVGGYSLLKAAIIPIAFLFFAIPLPDSVNSALTLQLQLISSNLGALFIRVSGFPVYLDGNIIDLGNYKLQIVDACSGLRYLYPLLSLSFLAAYLFHAPLWQRTFVFLSGIPIAIGMNGLRIGMVGILVDRWGAQMADGALHFFEGWVIFVACTALLAAEMYLFALTSGKAFSEIFHFPTTTLDVRSGHQSNLDSIQKPLMACLALLCVGGLAVYSMSDRSEIIHPRIRFVEFPTRIGQWQGHTSLLDPETEGMLDLDDYILSDYHRSDGTKVNMYIGYYASQRRRGEAPHSPLDCIPAGGWEISDFRQEDYISLNWDQPLNRVTIEKGTIKQLVYYWFNEQGRTVANENWAKFYRITDSIMKNRTDGALVRLTTQIKPNEAEDAADLRLRSFMQVALPHLTEFLPSSGRLTTKATTLRPSGQQNDVM